uniref:Uncharacterized protein n=1 Tax=Zea mays TaxID=4577 RepID=C0P993_MAIZE|nr:unknown [Zea mays]
MSALGLPPSRVAMYTIASPFSTGRNSSLFLSLPQEGWIRRHIARRDSWINLVLNRCPVGWFLPQAPMAGCPGARGSAQC